MKEYKDKDGNVLLEGSISWLQARKRDLLEVISKSAFIPYSRIDELNELNKQLHRLQYDVQALKPIHKNKIFMDVNFQLGVEIEPAVKAFVKLAENLETLEEEILISMWGYHLWLMHNHPAHFSGFFLNYVKSIRI